MLTIKWHGHACFELLDSKGRSIVIDPHDGRSIGIKPPYVKADAVLITHNHFDHNAYHGVLKERGEVHNMKVGRFNVLGYDVLGLRSYHDKSKGRRRGEVVIYRVSIEGLSVVHLSDLGYVLPDEELKALTPVNILMVPVGGTFTIDAREALQISEKLMPDVIIPMHYWIEGVNLPLVPVSDFLKIVTVRKIINLESNSWDVSKDSLPDNSVVVFKLA